MSFNGFNENVVILTGRAVSDAEVKNFGSSTLCSFRIVNNKRVKKKNSDEYIEKSCFIDCDTWGKRAEFAGKYVKKGKMIRVMAQLEQDEWEKDGVKKQKHKLYVIDVQVERAPKTDGADGASDGQPATAPATADATADAAAASLPF